ncbi:hypothetical protein ABPG75_009999 [Micractinium tetrahymenae]
MALAVRDALLALPPTLTALHFSDFSADLLATALERFPYLTALGALDLYDCSQADATAAAAMLRRPPRLSSIALGIHSFWGSEANDGYPSFADDDSQQYPFVDKDWVEIPPLAGISGLTALHIDGAAGLPPDWRQLRSLQCLRVTHNVTWAAPSQEDWNWGSFDWGPEDEPLSALTALTKVEFSETALLPELPLLAALPQLAELHAPNVVDTWQQELQQLRPGVRFV